MADELNPSGQESENEEVSWEDAFQEAAGGHSPEKSDEVEPNVVGGGRNGHSKSSPSNVDLDFLLDISLGVTAEIGRTKMLINELLQLNQGSIITLDKQVGESVDVLVNGKMMARGEVVMVNEMFAIRLTEIIGPKERIQQLT